MIPKFQIAKGVIFLSKCDFFRNAGDSYLAKGVRRRQIPPQKVAFGGVRAASPRLRRGFGYFPGAPHRPKKLPSAAFEPPHPGCAGASGTFWGPPPCGSAVLPPARKAVLISRRTCRTCRTCRTSTRKCWFAIVAEPQTRTMPNAEKVPRTRGMTAGPVAGLRTRR